MRTEDIIARQAATLLTTKLPNIRTSESVAVGDTAPDLVIAACFPEAFTFPDGDRLDATILAYLRAVRGGVRLSTIAERIGESEEKVELRLQQMETSEVVRHVGGLYYIAWAWRHILPEVITVEIPEEGAYENGRGDWEEAVRRAARARAFAHRTFVALPASIADSVQEESLFRSHAVGLLALSEGTGEPPVRLINSPRVIPSVWLHYYQAVLALSKRPAA